MRKSQLRSKRRRKSNMKPAIFMATLMLMVFFLVAYMAQEGILPKITFPKATPIPPSSITSVSDTITLPSRDYYAIQFGTFSTLEGAKAEASSYTDRGAAGYIWADGNYRVLAAIYSSLDDAQTIKDRLASQDISSYIFTVHQSALELRIEASNEQKAALQNAIAFITRASDELGALSMALDKQTMTVQEATEHATLLYGQAKAILDEMSLTLGNDEGGIVVALRTLMNQMMGAFSNVFSANSQDTVEMTAKIKYTYLEVLFNINTFVTRISARKV